VVAIVLVALACSAAARSREGAARRRTSRFARRGAEIALELPRFTLATGGGYSNDNDLTDDGDTDDLDLGGGLGFGFGIMFAFSGNIALDARMLQTSHTVPTDSREWDVDETFIGVRYIFMHENRWQPFVGIGGVRLALESSANTDLLTDFARLTGYGGIVYAGVDAVVSNRWVFSFRTDYAVVDYGDGLFGTTSVELEDAVDGDCLAFSLGVAYRVPMF